MSDPWNWMTAELAALEAQGILRRPRVVEPLPGGRCRVEGQLCWNFATNDALGLAGDERLAAAAQEALSCSGIGARASPLVCGRTEWHVRLEERLAAFKKAAAAILFPTGYAANLGTLTALAGPDDVLFCDRLAHASLIDGARLSRGRLRVFPHCRVDDLARDLERHRAARRRLIVTESLFSMDGDAAPLRELSRLADEFDALLIVDEAHATGLFGRHGSGLIAESLQEPPTSVSADSLSRIVPVGTLSKSVGTQGGFVTGSRQLIDWLWNTARTQIFSTALAVPVCAAAIRAIDLIEQEPHRRECVREAARQVRGALQEQGWQVPAGVAGPILPVVIGEAAATIDLAERLRSQGVLVGAIRPPTVPRGTSRLRISLSFAHGDEGTAALLSALERVRRPATA